MSLSKRDAMVLVASIRNAKVSGHAIAARVGGGHDAAMAGFLGGLESVLQHFLRQQGCSDAATALVRAMNAAPTEAQITEHNSVIERWRAKHAAGRAA